MPAPTPWAVEHDLSYAELAARRRDTTLAVSRRLVAHSSDTNHWISEIEHLRAHGVTDTEKLAKQIGLTQEAYEKRLARHIPPGQPGHLDTIAAAALDRMIAAGAPFTTEALPTPNSDTYITTQLRTAEKDGRITQNRDTPRSSNVLWRPTTPDEQTAILNTKTANQAAAHEKVKKADRTRKRVKPAATHTPRAA